jgi:nucleoside-diphosphate-sugar epimerase
VRLLVTGATGFVGRHVLKQAREANVEHLRAAVRRPTVAELGDVDVAQVGDLGRDTNWRAALDGVDAVVHAAARVHVMRETSAEADEEYRRINTEGTLALARQAAASGVRRFVFVSTVKVNGERTQPGHPYTATDLPAPVDAYGRSKLDAERGLRTIEHESGMAVTVVRPVLVYGPGVGANFRSLMRLVASGIPLPLGAVDNRRSLVAADNLANLLVRCAVSDAGAGATFFASDGEDLSTPELIRRIAAALGKRARLLPVPPSLLRASARALRREAWASRLCDSLQVDSTPARHVLRWTPPKSNVEALRETVENFVRES